MGSQRGSNPTYTADGARRSPGCDQPLTGNPVTYPEADEPETEKTRQAAQETTQKMIDQVGGPGPASVTVRAISGLAARELINASADADLVVVGSRGGGGFSKLTLGSVSGQVVNHAACPVVVIRGDR
jgi:nucleotide-binding universal stress UspA family protein